MGWAHDGAVTSSIANTPTATRVGGLGGEELESATACCVVALPGPTAAVPGPGSGVPEPGATTAVPGPPVEVPEPASGFPMSDRLHQGQAVRRWSLILETA